MPVHHTRVRASSASLHCSRAISGIVTVRSNPQNTSDLAWTIADIADSVAICLSHVPRSPEPSAEFGVGESGGISFQSRELGEVWI